MRSTIRQLSDTVDGFPAWMGLRETVRDFVNWSPCFFKIKERKIRRLFKPDSLMSKRSVHILKKKKELKL